MGCKFCKIRPFEQEEIGGKKRHRRSKHRKRHGKSSNHRRRQQSGSPKQVKDEVIHIEDLTQNNFDRSKYERKPFIASIVDGNEHPIIVDELIDIKAIDPEAFNGLFVQQRQQAIDNPSYRSTVESWRPKSFQHLTDTIKSFSRGKSFVDQYWIIFYWIACNIEYDTVSYFANNYKDQSAQAVFRRRKGVCAGYANLYKYLCDQLQIPCEIVSGYSKGYGFDGREEAPTEVDHAWNAVQMNGHWYLIESTWGAGHLDDRKEFNRELTSYYFLPRPNEMIYHHLPEDDQWQLLRRPISMAQYMQIPKLRPIFFEFNLQLIQPRNQYFVTLQPSKPFARVIVKAPSGIHLTADLKLQHKKIEGGDFVVFDRKKQQYYCYFAPSDAGKHKITIYAKRGETTVGAYHAALDLALQIGSRPENPISYPKTWNCFSDLGLEILSPLGTHAIDLTNGEGFAKILIRTPFDVQLIGQLKNLNDETIVCGDRVYYDRSKDFWRCKFAPNESGIFKAIILAKKKTDPNTYQAAVSFKVFANHLPSPPFSFPTTWQLFYDLDLRILYPADRGIIVLTNKTRFAEIRIKTPNDVHLLGRVQNDEGETVGGGEQVYYDSEKDFWRCKFAPQQIGVFDAIILAKKKSDLGSFRAVVLFKIELRELSGQPASFSKTTQLFYDLNLKVLSPTAHHKIVLSKKSSYVEISLKTPNDVALLGQLVSPSKGRILNADQVYYDRHEDIWRCRFAPNEKGLFDAIILAKKKSETDLYSTVITYQIEATHLSTSPRTFPQTWQSFYDFDLKIEAPHSSSSVVWPQDASYTEVLMQTPDDVQLSCRIEYNNMKIENGSLAQFDQDRKLWQLLFAPEQPGQHELVVYARRITDTDSFSNVVVKFNLDVTTLRKPMKFPIIYKQFERTKCRIYTPLNGVLQKGSVVPIYCIIPDAESVLITVGSKQVRSNDYADSILKHEITVGSTGVTIYGKYHADPHYTSLICYSVK